MKTRLSKLTGLSIPSIAIAAMFSSCGAPDPNVQKQMDQDILTAAENRKAGNTTGPQQGQGSKNWGHGGF